MSEKSLSKNTRKKCDPAAYCSYVLQLFRSDRSVCTGTGSTGGNGKSYLFVTAFAGNISGLQG